MVVTILVQKRSSKEILSVSLIVAAVICVIPFFWIINAVSPGFLAQTWLWENLSGIKFTVIPIEDLIFYFLAGFLYGPFYLFWKSERLRS